MAKLRQFPQADRLRTNTVAQVLIAFGLVLAVKWPVLNDPPVWDTAMTIFPAAITLENFNFDLVKLFQQPGYPEGGPNVHADSIMTLATAALIRITKGTGLTLPVIHLLHFLITALTLVAAFRYSAPLLGEKISLLTSLAMLTFPLFLTQAGYMYLEMPLALTALMAVHAWTRGRFYQAVFWSFLACWVKQTGIIVPGALIIAVLLQSGVMSRKILRAAIIGLPTLAIAWLQHMRLHGTTVARATSAQPSWLDLEIVVRCLQHDIPRYLSKVPDLTVFILLFLVVTSLCYPRIWRGLRLTANSPASRSDQVLALNALLVTGYFGLLYVVAPVSSFGYCSNLPRYHVVLIPFMFATLAFGATRLLSSRQMVWLLVFLIVYFVINRNGLLYPTDVDIDGRGNHFAITERSGAYRQLLETQQEAMAFVQGIPAAYPLYYGRHEHYLNSFPLMGYVGESMTNGRYIGQYTGKELAEELKQTRPSAAAHCSYFLYNYPWLGGGRILHVLSRLKDITDIAVIRVFESGPYKIHLIRASKIGERCWPDETLRSGAQEPEKTEKKF